MAKAGTRPFDAPTFLSCRGVASTPRRVAVVRALRASRAPVPASELLARVRQAVRINKVTLYRILDDLVARRGARRIPGAEGKACRFELAGGGSDAVHPHAECRACGGMECLLPVNLSGLSRSAARRGFAIDRVSVVVEGVCGHCRGR
jgi:Fe2+ or Zn2+ uptake regulation protein